MASIDSKNSVEKETEQDNSIMEVARESYCSYMNEVYEFFETNEKQWGFSDNPKYDLLRESHYYLFTLTSRQMVVLWAYMHRKRFHDFVTKKRILCRYDVMSDEALEELVLQLNLNETSHLLKFFWWIAYLFEMCIYFRFRKFSYGEIWGNCKSELAFHFFLRSFFPKEEELEIEATKVKADICRLCPALEEAYFGTPVCCDISSLFPQVVGTVVKAYKYDKFWKSISGKGTLNDVFSESLRVLLSEYSQRQVFMGYISRYKIIPQEKYEVSPCSMDGYIYVVKDNLKSVRSSSDTRERKANQEKKSTAFDDTKSFFIVHRKFLLKRHEVKNSACKYEYKRDIKVYDFFYGNFALADGYMNMLNESIENNNIHEFGNGYVAVYSSNSNFSDQIIVLDTTSSSEEDESQLSPCQRKFIENVMPKVKKWKYFTINEDKGSKDLYQTRDFRLRRKAYKTLRNVELENSMRGKVMVTDESNSTAKTVSERIKSKRQNRRRERVVSKTSEIDSQKNNSVDLEAEKKKIESFLLGIVPHVTGTEDTDLGKNNSKKTKVRTQKSTSVIRTKNISKQKREVSQNLKSLIRLQKDIFENTTAIKHNKPAAKSIKPEMVSMNTHIEEICTKNNGVVTKINKYVFPDSNAQNAEINKSRGKDIQQSEISTKVDEVLPKVKEKMGDEGSDLTKQVIENSASASSTFQEIPMEDTGAKPKVRKPYPETIPPKKSSKKKAKKNRKSARTTMAITEPFEYNIKQAVDDFFENLDLDPAAETKEKQKLFEHKAESVSDEVFADKLKK